MHCNKIGETLSFYSVLFLIFKRNEKDRLSRGGLSEFRSGV